MRHNKLLPYALAAILTGLFFHPFRARSEQSRTNRVSLNDLYGQILNTVFPTLAEPPTGYLLLATLRFSPSNAPESQINITEDIDGEYTFIEYSLPPGSTSISSRLSELYQNRQLGTYDPSELAKRFMVQVRTASVSVHVRKELFAQLDRVNFPSTRMEPNKIFLPLDTPRYDFWYKSYLLCEMHITCNCTQHLRGNSRELANWMDRVKEAVEASPSLQKVSEPPIPAGVATGGLSGEVLDADDKAISNAEITLVNGVTGTRWPIVKSAADGSYSILGLPPGKYSITVKKANFQTFYSNDLSIEADQVRNLRVILKIHLGQK